MLGLGLLACRPGQPTITPDEGQAGSEVTIELPARPAVDAEAMMASIEWLASDERQGRFTFDPQIEEVASWIAGRYEALGLEPVSGAAGLRVGYELRTKVEAGASQTLIVERRGEPVEVAAERFTPRAEGASGTAKGEVVFVGYGVSWTRPEGAQDSDPAIDSYDDLAGVDLDGKIVLALTHAPNTPDLAALFGAMQDLAETFERAAAPLREADARAKLQRLHRKAREDLLALVEPFAETKDLSDAYWKVEDPKARLDIMALASEFISRTKARPQFDLREFSMAKKAARLAEAGAAGVIFVQGPRSFVGREARDADALPGVLDEGRRGGHGRVIPESVAIPVVQLSWKQADKLFSIGGQRLSKLQAAIDADYQPRSQALGVSAELETELISERVEVPNVLAQLPGKTDEIIMLGAHFDHIGNDETGNCRAIVRRDERDAICNGADDNASGTAMLLDLARAYEDAGVTPERTIVFAHFSGEELGLLGSQALIGDSPFDQSRVVAMVNLDMVGRLGPSGLAIGGLGSSADWLPLLDELGNHGMKILYEGSTTTRSDHAWWFHRQIPVLFFFTGIHGDYHRAGDEIDEINVEGLAKVGQLVSDVVWELASGRAIAWTEPAHGDGIGRGLPGSDPSTVIMRVDEQGVRVDEDGNPIAAAP
ncbi:Aminopeptidase S [Enhygromyxa salina]|uniref:Aminopeptidase S n=2 Tax=Enhygromyxa salina TaxID=215803 RepID=A0A2S9XCC3_9BACT|nr:Aminopeptidase S [Enhygromyxa salina]